MEQVMRTGDGGGVCLRVGTVLRASSLFSSHGTTGEQSSTNPVVMTLGDDAQTRSAPSNVVEE